MAGRPVDEMLARLRLDDAEFKRNAAESANVFTKLQNMFKKPSDLNLDKSVKSISNLQNGLKNINVNALNSAVDTINRRFSVLGIVGDEAIRKITRSVMDLGEKMVKALTTDGIRDGFREYEVKMGSIQTILANTAKHGTTLSQVNSALDDLNTYADKTVYSFSDMTRNIGLFTNAGIKVEDATSMIKGFSNEAAASGTTSAYAANAAYQLSQALSAGEIRLMDWRSLTNAGMGNKNMQNGLIEIAQAMGQFSDGTQTASDVSKGFNASLKSGWLSADVMSAYLRIMAGDMNASAMASMGLSEAQIKAFQTQQKTAEEAATKVRTFTQLIGTAKEAIGSGWAKTFEIVFGSFDEATELWSNISKPIEAFIETFSNARNNFLQAFVDIGGKKHIIEGLAQAFRFLGEVVTIVGGAFASVFPTISQFFAGSGKDGGALSKWFGGTEETKQEFSDIQKYADEVILGVYGNGQARIEALEALGLNYERIQDRVNTILMPDYVSKFTDESTALGQATSRMGFTVRDFISDTDSGVKQLGVMANSFKNFFTNLKISDEVGDKLSNVFKGFFSVIDTGLSIISKLGTALGGILKIAAPVVGGFLLDMLDQLATGLIKINEFVTSNSLGSIIETVFTSVASMLGVSEGSIQTIIGWFDNLGKSIKNMWDMLTNDGPLASGAGATSSAGNAGGGAGGPFNWFVSGLLAVKGAFEWLRTGGIGSSAVTVFNGVSKAIGWIGSKAKAAYTPIHNFISPIMNAAKTKVGGWFDNTVDWFKNIGDWSSRAWPAVQTLMGTLGGELGVVASGAGDWLGTMADGFKKLGETLWQWFGTSFDSVKGSLSGLWDWLKELANAPEVAIEQLGVNLSGAIQNMSDFFGEMSTFLQPMFDFLGQFSKTDLVWIGSLIGVFYTIKELVKLANTIKAPQTSVGEVFKSLTGMFKSIGGAFKDIGTIARASKWLTFALSIGILADSLNKLSSLDPNALATGGLALAGIIVGLVGSMKILSGVTMPKGLGTTMLLFSVTLKILTNVIKDLGSMDQGQLMQGAITVALLSTVMALSVGLIGLLNSLPSSSGGGLKGAGMTLLGLGVAVKLIGSVVKELGSLNPSVLQRGMSSAIIIAGSITVFTSLLSGISKIGSFSGGLGNASVMIAMSLSIKMLADTIGQLGSYPTDILQKGLVTTGILALALGGSTGLLALMSKIGGLGAGLGTAVSLGVMAASISELADVVVMLGAYPADQLSKGLSAVSIIAGGLSIFSSLTLGIAGLAGKGAGINSGISMGALALATIEIGDLVIKLGDYDSGKLKQGLIAVSVIAGGISVFSSLANGISGLAMKSGGAWASLGSAVSMGSLTYSTIEIAKLVLELGSYDSGTLSKGMRVISVIFGGSTLALLAGSLGTLGGGVGSGVMLVALGYGIGKLADGIIQLGEANPEVTGQGIKVLAAALTVLLAAGAIATYFGLSLGLAAIGVAAGGLGALAAGAGIGVKAFAEGMTILYDLLTRILKDLGEIIDKLIGWFGDLAQGISDFVTGWSEGDQAIMEIATAEIVDSKLQELENKLGIGKANLREVAYAAIDGLAEGLESGETSIEEATTLLASVLQTQFNLTEADATMAAREMLDAIMLEMDMSNRPTASIAGGAKSTMELITGGINAGGQGVLDAAKGWMASIASALSVSFTAPEMRGGSTGPDTPKQPKQSSAPVVQTTAQPIVNATPVNMEPAIQSMAKNAIRMGTTYVAGINKYIPQSRQAGFQVASNAVNGSISELPRFTLTGTSSGRNYSVGVQNTANISRAAGNIIGVQSNSGARTGSVGMYSSGSESGGRYTSGVSSRGSSAWSAGSLLASRAASGSNSVSLYSVGSGLGQGFVNGISSRASAAWAAGASLASASNSGIRSRAQMRSPSRLTFKTAGDFVMGWVNGVKRGAKKSYAAASYMAGAAVDAVKEYAHAYMTALEEESVYEPTVKPILDLSNVDGLGSMSYNVRAAVSTNGMSNNDMMALNSITMDRHTIDLANNIGRGTQSGQNETLTVDQSTHYNVNNDGLFEGATFTVREEADINKIVSVVRNTFTKESELNEIFNRGRG